MNFLFFSMGLTSLLDFCANPPGPPTQIDMVCPKIYKMSGGIKEMTTEEKYFKGVLMDFKEHTQTLFNETAATDYRVLWKRSADGQERYIEELTGDQQYYHVNATDNKCTKNATKPRLVKNSRFESIIGNDTSSLNSIINGIIEFYKTEGGYVLKDSSENNKAMVACIDGATKRDTKVVLEIGYLLQPNLTSAEAVTAAVRMIEVADYRSTEALSQVSIDFESYHLPDKNKPLVLGGLSGIYYHGKSYLPFVQLDEFSGVFNYFDGSNNKSTDIEVYYSKSRQLFIRATEDDETRDKDYYEFDPTTHFLSLKGMNYIARDFKYGYEVTMRDGLCKAIRALDNSTSDVLFANKTIESTILDTMISDYHLKFDLYENEVDHFGRSYKVYRAFNGPLVYDVHVNKHNKIHSISKRGKYDGKLRDKLTITPTSIEESKLPLKLNQIFNCIDSGNFSENILLDSLRDKNITGLTDFVSNHIKASESTGQTSNSGKEGSLDTENITDRFDFVSNELSDDKAAESVKVNTATGQKSGVDMNESLGECIKVCLAKTGLAGY